MDYFLSELNFIFLILPLLFWGVILRKAGYCWAWVIPCIIPLFMVVLIWVLAYANWGNKVETSVKDEIKKAFKIK